MIEDKFNLNNISLTGDDPYEGAGGLYTFEGQQYTRKPAEDNAEVKDLDFIDIGKRER